MQKVRIYNIYFENALFLVIGTNPVTPFYVA